MPPGAMRPIAPSLVHGYSLSRVRTCCTRAGGSGSCDERGGKRLLCRDDDLNENVIIEV